MRDGKKFFSLDYIDLEQEKESRSYNTRKKRCTGQKHKGNFEEGETIMT